MKIFKKGQIIQLRDETRKFDEYGINETDHSVELTNHIIKIENDFVLDDIIHLIPQATLNGFETYLLNEGYASLVCEYEDYNIHEDLEDNENDIIEYNLNEMVKEWDVKDFKYEIVCWIDITITFIYCGQKFKIIADRKCDWKTMFGSFIKNYPQYIKGKADLVELKPTSDNLGFHVRYLNKVVKEFYE